jgi:hypothetical protein
LHRKRSPLIYKAPLVLINKACTKFLFSGFDVLFQDDFQSIAGPSEDKEQLLFLTAVLGSPLAQYVLFHTTATIGIERDIARLEEMLELPFPLPERMPDPIKATAIVGECAAVMLQLQQTFARNKNILSYAPAVKEAKQQVTKLVYDYFGLSTWERYLIEDTVRVFRRSSQPGSIYSENLITAKPSRPPHRKAYAETLLSTFRGWSRTKKPLWAQSYIASKWDMAFITFGVGGGARPYREAPAEKRVEALLSRIRESMAADGSVFRCMRGFAFYEGSKVHLLKPLSRRFWTRTAALNDADEILAQMLEEGGWGV